MRKNKSQIIALLSSVAVLFSSISIPAYADIKGMKSATESNVVQESNTQDDSYELGLMSVDFKNNDVDYSGYLGEPDWFANYDSSDYQKDSGLLTSTSLPKSYSSVDYGYITPVKNQNPYGTCWTFATMASSEASLIKEGMFSKEEADFSEYHLAYFANHPTVDPLGGTKGDYGCLGTNTYGYLDEGGNYTMSTETLAKWLGVVKENVAEYGSCNYNTTLSDSIAYTKDVAHLENTEIIPISDRDAVKAKIMEYGAGGFSYNHANSYLATDGVSYYNYFDTDTNHAVTVVGWDDSYAASKFRSNPGGNGAWLIKNSWGTSFGNNGYFWISYYDTSIADSVTFFDYGSSDNFDNNYQYDGSVPAGFSWVTSSVDNITGANAFVAQSDEVLKAVSFQTYYDINVNYTIQIYTGLSATGIPTSGTAAYTTPIKGVVGYPGYHTIRLDTPVSLKQGERYAVVLNLYLDHESIAYGGKMAFPIERNESATIDGVTRSITSAERYQSYLLNGSVWTDVQDFTSFANRNLKIKAFTDTVYSGEREPAYIKVTKPHRVNYYYNKEEKIDLTGMEVYCYYTDGSYEIVSSGYKVISNIDFGKSGNQDVTVSYGDFSTTFSIYVDSGYYMELVKFPAYVNKGATLTSGMFSIKVYYLDGTSAIVPFSTCKISGYSKSVAGIQKVTVKYDTNIKTFDLRSVSISKPTVKAEAYNKVKISWKCTPECTGYDVYRAKAGSTSYTKIGTAKSGNEYFYDTKVTVGQAYTYKIKPAIGYDVFEGSTFAVSAASASVKTTLATPKITAGKNLAYNQNKIAWGKVTGAQGYLVYRKTAKTGYSLVGTITSGSTVTFTDKKATTGTTYYYVVKAYRTVNGKKVPSEKSAAKAIKTVLPTTKIYSAVVSKSTITVKWNKVTGASGYEVYMATSANGKYVKKATVSSSKLSSKISGLSKDKYYYFKIKPYRTVNGKKVYATASPVAKIKTLKK